MRLSLYTYSITKSAKNKYENYQQEMLPSKLSSRIKSAQSLNHVGSFDQKIIRNETYIKIKKSIKYSTAHLIVNLVEIN